MLKRMFVFTVLLIGTLLLVNEVVIPHVRRSRGHNEFLKMSLEKGRDVVTRAIAAHGGWEAWQNKVDVRLRLIDESSSFLGAVMLDMWPGRRVETTQHYLLRQNAGRLEMNTGAGQHIWAYRGFHPQALLNGRLDQKNIARANFTIPFSNYLLELPYRFMDNGAFPEFVNEIRDGEKTYDRVRVTFGLNAGQYPPDEFIADFDQATGRLAHLEYTMRGKMPGYVSFRADLKNYQQFDGIWMPAQIDFSMVEPCLHLKLNRWQISGVVFNTGVGESFFNLTDAHLTETATNDAMGNKFE